MEYVSETKLQRFFKCSWKIQVIIFPKNVPDFLIYDCYHTSNKKKIGMQKTALNLHFASNRTL